MTISRPVLRYYGGKWRLALWIISNFPPHRVYVEPFGGAGSVLMRKPRSYAEVYNDQWGTVVNVFKVLRDPLKAQELERLVRLTPFARDEFDLCTDISTEDGLNDVELARRTIYRAFSGFGSGGVNTKDKHTTGFRANSNRSGTIPANDWRNYPEEIRSFTERLRGVVIENRPAIQVIQAHDGPETLHYVDPPYPHSTRNQRHVSGVHSGYGVEMADHEHAELARILRMVSGMVIISGYRCELYDQLFSDWRRADKKTYADGARARTESLWFSPNIEYMGLF